jgi:hypothetical protein
MYYLIKKRHINPAFRRPRQEHCEFKASVGYTVRPCPKNARAGDVAQW